jgi:serine/threonine protein kinase
MQTQQYSWKSDVWSFGVVVAEIFLDGQTPYADLDTQGVIRHVVASFPPFAVFTFVLRF